MVLSIIILVVFQVLEVFNTPYLPSPPLIPSANINIWKEEQPMRILTHFQESPIFALHGRYSTVFLVQHSWLIDIIHSRNECESSPVKDLIPLAIHPIPRVPIIPHQKKFHRHTTGFHQSYPQCCREDFLPWRSN